MKASQLAIIINSFNRRDLLERCLQSLAKWLPDTENRVNAKIFVYDAGSNDGSQEWLREECKLSLDIELIDGTRDSDSSFATGLNKASETAIQSIPNLDYLLFYETDNEIGSRDAIDQAIESLENDDSLAACGFTVRRHDGSSAGPGMPFPKLRHYAVGKKITSRFKRERIVYDWEKIGEALFSYADVVLTSPLLVKKRAWIESSGLNAEDFPFSDCDIDWAKRLHNQGWRMGLIQRDDVIYDNSDSLSSWSQNRAMHYHKARLKYFKVHHPKLTPLVWPHFLALRHCCELIFITLFVHKSERRNHLKRIAKDLLKGVFKSYG